MIIEIISIVLLVLQLSVQIYDVTLIISYSASPARPLRDKMVFCFNLGKTYVCFTLKTLNPFRVLLGFRVFQTLNPKNPKSRRFVTLIWVTFFFRSE